MTQAEGSGGSGGTTWNHMHSAQCIHCVSRTRLGESHGIKDVTFDFELIVAVFPEPNPRETWGPREWGGLVRLGREWRHTLGDTGRWVVCGTVGG